MLLAISSRPRHSERGFALLHRDSVFLLWVVVLAVTLLRIGDTAAAADRQHHLAA
jgi:hypothetical protein